MREPIVTADTPEKAYLFGVESKGDKNRLWPIENSLRELSRLARTAGLDVVDSSYQRLSNPNPATYMGAGKLEEIHQEMTILGAETLILNEELKPGQQRKIEEALGDAFKVIDRTALILDIFAQHAHTREGQLQVELAQCQYRLPRLTRLWTHLVRQSGGRDGGKIGGVGLRGPGETQLEADRRQIRSRISVLKKELEDVRGHRKEYRRRRNRRELSTVSLVGYTNAGKSSLLKALSQAEVLVEDKLFTTLDPKTRRIRLPGGRIVLFTDTVGFIDKLPHDLVAAFRATFEEIAEADLILRIVDISHPGAEAHIKAVDRILHDLGATGSKTLTVWNKIDRIEDMEPLQDHVLRISALRGDGLDRLLERVETILNRDMEYGEFLLPYNDGYLLNAVHCKGNVDTEEYREGGIFIRAAVPPLLSKRLEPFRARS